VTYKTEHTGSNAISSWKLHTHDPFQFLGVDNLPNSIYEFTHELNIVFFIIPK